MSTILFKRCSISGVQPDTTELSVGELAINTADGTLFTKLSNGTVVPIGGGLITSVNGQTGVVNLTAADLDAAPIASPDFSGTPTVETTTILTEDMDLTGGTY